jgi:hypothetical protein
MSRIDLSRPTGVLDVPLLSTKRIAVIGVGGASGLVQGLSRVGISKWIKADPDWVSATNIATQDYPLSAIGQAKVEALNYELDRIGGVTEVARCVGRYEDLTETELELVWSADLVLAMTDQFSTNALVNRHAIVRGVDCVFAICYPGCVGVEVTATFADGVAAGFGCHRCHTKLRYDGYAAGYVNPPVLASHALAAMYLNSLIAHIVLGRLHAKAGSDLPIAEIGHVFAQAPCLISSVVPSFGLGPGEAFDGQAPMPFRPSLWPLDTPENFVCPDCNTRGCVPVGEAQFDDTEIPERTVA